MDLSIRYREKGDTEAGYKLVTANLRLVVKIAMDFQRYWMQNLMDLVQEGNVGLMQAAKKFDPYKGYKFSYYASFWIKAYIIKFIMDNWKLVKIGTTQAQRKLFFNLRKEKERLEAQGTEASPLLLSQRLGRQGIGNYRNGPAVKQLGSFAGQPFERGFRGHSQVVFTLAMTFRLTSR